MKTLVNPQITVADGKITIVAEIKDVQFNAMLVTKTSHGHLNPENIKHPRRVVSSSAAIFLESPAGKLAIPNSFVAAIAAHAFPESSFPPVFKHGSTPNKVQVVSETPVTLQWQVSDNEAYVISDKPDTAPTPAIYTDIPNATGDSLDESLVKSKQWIRCVAKNMAGQTITKPFQKP